VPRFQERDSAQLFQRDRTCFSSSCAMLLEAIKPGTLKGANGDDQYLAVVQRSAKQKRIRSCCSNPPCARYPHPASR
jgi:hypothetical protein